MVIMHSLPRFSRPPKAFYMLSILHALNPIIKRRKSPLPSKNMAVNYPFDPKSPQPWFCGHCHAGPRSVKSTEECNNCGRLRDSTAFTEQSPQPWFCGHCHAGPRSVKSTKECNNCGRPRDSTAFTKSPKKQESTFTPWSDSEFSSSNNQSYKSKTDPRNRFPPNARVNSKSGAKTIVEVPFDPKYPKPWYCGNCHDGPHNVKYNKQCVNCHKVRDSTAYTKSLIKQDSNPEAESRVRKPPSFQAIASFNNAIVLNGNLLPDTSDGIPSHQNQTSETLNDTKFSKQVAAKNGSEDDLDRSESDVESIFSLAESANSSMTSLEGSESLADLAACEFTSDLLNFQEIKHIFTWIKQGNRLSADKFERNCRRLLDHYSLNLRKGLHGTHERATAAMIRRRSRRIAHDMRQELTDSRSVRSEDGNTDLKRQIDRYLGTISTGNQSGSELESDDSDMEWMDEEGLPNYSSVKKILVQT